MSKNIIKGEIQKKLDYLKLDLDDIPGILTDFEALEFNVSRLSNDKDHRIFRFVPINKIDILITPCLRTDPLKDKYSKAVPLHKFIIQGDKEEDIAKFTTFLRMLDTVKISEIETVAASQKQMEKKEPFRVKYPKDNMWQIYYSEATDRFFMLVCSKEETFAEFFYLIKAKLDYLETKSRVVPKIYVPINSLNYSESFLNRTEIADMENYLWLFTKNWALIFEVYGKSNNISLQITGETVVYENVKSSYKIKISKRDEALKFYKLLKALFILQTEIKNKYVFTTKIDSNNSLELYYENTRLTFDVLMDFIKEEVNKVKDEIKMKNELIIEVEEQLYDLKTSVDELEEEYLVKQKEISTFLEYRKTFIGKMKYFFRSAKSNKKSNKKKNTEEYFTDEIFEGHSLNKIIDVSATELLLKDKKFCTIEDLVTVYSLLEKGEKNCKELKQDFKAMQLKHENLISKVRNATLYIEEIDKHRKSIFDFWKFSNKDEKLSLEIGNETETEDNKKVLKKCFDLETEFEDLGAKVDTIQRKKLSREELDSLFVAKAPGMLEIINMVKDNDLDQEILEDKLDSLIEEFNSNRLIVDSETFDIFGNVADDSRKLKYIGSRGHRENERNLFKILNINRKIDVFDFTEKLQFVKTYLDGATPKCKAEYDFSLYKLCQINEKILENGFDIYNINLEKALEEFNDDGEGALNLIKLNYKEGLPLLYYSNIVFFENTNQTLPIGMELSSSVFLDANKLSFELVNKTKFRTNNYFTESKNLILPKAKDVFVYEYNVELKNKED